MDKDCPAERCLMRASSLESFINQKHYSSDLLKERMRILLLGIDYVFIKGISAFETGHLHNFGNGVFLGSIEFFRPCQVSWFYFLNCFWPASFAPASASCF